MRSIDWSKSSTLRANRGGIGLVALALEERLAAEQQVVRTPVQRVRLLVRAQRLAQLADLCEEGNVAGARGEHRLIALERSFGRAGLLEPLGGELLIQLTIRELARQIEGPRGRVLVTLLQEGVAEVQIDVRRNEFSEPDQTTSEGELLTSISVSRIHAEPAARRLGEFHELAQNRRATRTSRGE